jgi:hypothetical protein
VTLALPLPARAAVCGLPSTVSLTFRVATKPPLPLGKKLTLTVQLPFAGSELGQLLVCEKLLLLAPVMAMDEMLTGVTPVFVAVTFMGLLVVPAFWVGKARLDGESRMPRTTCERVAVLDV